jgi:hypothetical protein
MPLSLLTFNRTGGVGESFLRLYLIDQNDPKRGVDIEIGGKCALLILGCILLTNTSEYSASPFKTRLL